LPPRSGLRGLPPPPCEGDRDQRWSDQGSVALFLSFSPFIFLFCLLLAFRSGVSELPSPPLSFPIFLFTSPSSDLSLYGGNLLEALGDSSLQRTPSLLAARICFSSGCQDLSQLRMFGEQWFWGSLLVRVSFNYPIFGVDYSKLFFMKSPCHTRIVWQIRFDLMVACLAGIKAPKSLLVRTSLVGVALILFWIVVKFCVAWCPYCYCCCLLLYCCYCCLLLYCCCCSLLLLCFLLLYSLATLCVGFTTLFVGFCFPLCRDVVLLLLVFVVVVFSFVV
jgi:hypothetical protein